MASTAFHFNNQVEADGECRLFDGCDGYADGEQRRDFVYVDDIVDDQSVARTTTRTSPASSTPAPAAPDASTTSRAPSSPGTARASIKYIPFPDNLKGRYQSFTEANLDKLRAGRLRPTSS